jgi:hypothetical protein
MQSNRFSTRAGCACGAPRPWVDGGMYHCATPKSMDALGKTLGLFQRTAWHSRAKLDAREKGGLKTRTPAASIATHRHGLSPVGWWGG